MKKTPTRIFTLLLVFAILWLPHAAKAATSSTATAAANATVRPGGPRTGATANNFLNVEGSNNGANSSFGVIDFSIASFGVATSVSQVNSITLNLTELNAGFSLPGGLNFYLTTDTTTSIANTAGASPLIFDVNSPPEGLGTQLAPNYLIGTGTFNTTGNTNSGQVDSYTLTLSGTAQSYLLSQLQAGSGTLRLIVTASQATTAATYAGATTTATTSRPNATLDVTFATNPNYTWKSGDGNWNPAGTAGDVNWDRGSGVFGPWDSSKTAIFNATPGTVTLTGAVTAAGVQFDSDGYVVAGNGNTLTLSAANTRVAVTNATDTATISASIAGTNGLAKTGLGRLVLSGANTYTGITSIQGGTLSVAADTNLGNSANEIALSGGTLQTTTANFSTARTLNGTGGTIDANTSATFSGTINTGAVTLLSAATVNLTGASKTVGGFRFQQGSTLVSSGGVLNLTGTTFSNNTTGTAVLQGAIDLGSAAVTFNTAEGSAAVDLQINGNVTSTAGRLTKSGLGTLELIGDNSGLGGGASIGAGKLLVHNDSALGTAAQLFFNGGTLETQNLAGTTTFASGVSFGAGALATPNSATFQGNNTVFSGNSGFFKNGGAAQAVYQHSITVTDTKVTLTGDLTAMTTATTGFTLSGNGTLEIAGNGLSLFDSTQTINVQAGATLLANRSDAFGPARGVIGGRLGGTGSVADLTLDATGVIAPGNSVGTISAASLLWNAGGSMDFEIGSLSDLFVISGALTKGNTGRYNFSFTNSGGLTTGQTITLIQFNSTNFTVADFSASGVNGNFMLGANALSFTVSAIPEPSSYLLCGLSLAGFALLRRKRKVSQ